ncbi:MAG: hypothetical protein IT559_02560 [Alphaproteobacteria bacterium]|nr:hypothetical protein [Alphaproteobacteria bacterium]
MASDLPEDLQQPFPGLQSLAEGLSLHAPVETAMRQLPRLLREGDCRHVEMDPFPAFCEEMGRQVVFMNARRYQNDGADLSVIQPLQNIPVEQIVQPFAFRIVLCPQGVDRGFQDDNVSAGSRYSGGDGQAKAIAAVACQDAVCPRLRPHMIEQSPVAPAAHEGSTGLMPFLRGGLAVAQADDPEKRIPPQHPCRQAHADTGRCVHTRRHVDDQPGDAAPANLCQSLLQSPHVPVVGIFGLRIEDLL